MSRTRGAEPPGPEPRAEPPRTEPPRAEPPRDGAPVGDAELLSSSPFEDDLDDALAGARPRRRSLPGPTLYLAAGILLVGGFLGGVQAQKWSSDDSGSPGAGRGPGSAAAGGYAAGRAPGGYPGMPGMPGMPEGGIPGGMGPGGAAGGRGGTAASGDVTSGTVVKISGSTLYLRTTSGDTVKVKTSGTTKVRITEDGALKDLGSGATVTVRGTKGEDGTLTATTVSKGSGR